MLVIKYAIILYLLYAISLVIHETGHYIVAKYVIGSCDEICIGNKLYIVNSQKVKISPIIITGYVGVDNDKLIQSKIYNIIMFFLMGPIMNMIVGVIIYYINQESTLLSIFGILNMWFFIIGIIPVKGSDVNSLIRVIIHKKKYNI